MTLPASDPHPYVALALQILQGLLTPVIACIALYIAWQQWKVNERKFQFDTYERRLHVYQEVLAILRLVVRDFKPEVSDLQKFRIATTEADFLFETEVPAYLDEIVKRGVALNTAHFEYRGFNQAPPAGYDPEKVVNKITEQEEWFAEQLRAKGAMQKFKKYLVVRR